MRWKLICLWYKISTIYKAGKRIYELEMKHPITIDTILNVCDDFVEFNDMTQVNDIKKYLYSDNENRIIRIVK
jgi:hypothetical protein